MKVNCKIVLEIILRLLTNQSARDLIYLKFNKNIHSPFLKVSAIVLIVIWLQSASVLTKAFTGILLNSYFNLKIYPVVNNLEDLYGRKDLGVACHKQTFNIPGIDQYVEPKIIRDLTTRCSEYNNMLDNKLKIVFPTHLTTSALFNEIVTGKTVILATTNAVRDYQNQFIKWSNLFTVSEHKLFNLFHIFIVSKNNKYTLNPFIRIM